MKKSLFDNLIKIIKEDSKNYNIFDVNYLIKNPQVIIIYRLFIKMTQIEFCKKIGLSRRHLVSMENGTANNLRKSTAEKIFVNLKETIKDMEPSLINKLDLYNKYLLFKVNGKMNPNKNRILGSFISSENNVKKGYKLAKRNTPDNEFENKIFKILKKIK